MNSVRNGQLYSVSVHTQPSFAIGNPVALPIEGFIQCVGNWRDYDITPDGRFIMMFPPADATSEASQPPQNNVVLH